MIEPQQIVDWFTSIIANAKQGAWLAATATIMMIVSILWKGEQRLPWFLAPISTWIAAEQKKHFSSYCQWISRGLTLVNAVLASLLLGMPFTKAIVAALMASWGGTALRDLGTVGIKAALKATPKMGIFVIAFGCVFAPATSGCWLSNVCGEDGLQVAHDVGVQLGEAQAMVDLEEQAIAQMQGIPSDKAAEIQAAFIKVHTAIEVAEVGNKTVQQACAGAGVVTILGDVAEALGVLWPLILPLMKSAKLPPRMPSLLHLAPQVAAMKAAKAAGK